MKQHTASRDPSQATDVIKIKTEVVQQVAIVIIDLQQLKKATKSLKEKQHQLEVGLSTARLPVFSSYPFQLGVCHKGSEKYHMFYTAEVVCHT